MRFLGKKILKMVIFDQNGIFDQKMTKNSIFTLGDCPLRNYLHIFRLKVDLKMKKVS
jgi:hypothetical protein